MVQFTNVAITDIDKS